MKAHLTSIFATIGVADRTSAALWAERHRMGGLLRRQPRPAVVTPSSVSRSPAGSVARGLAFG